MSQKHRGISEIIGTLTLLMVTVTGSVSISYFMNDALLVGNAETISTIDSSAKSIQLISYDTRDSTRLLQISNLDNKFDQQLCGFSCKDNSYKIPANDGTEFIILQIENTNIDSIFLDNIKINEISHVWDIQTSGKILDASQDDLISGAYPLDGKFSILPVNTLPIVQKYSNEIQSGEQVQLLVKLGAGDTDISLNKAMKIVIGIGTIDSPEFILISGEVR